MGSGTFGAAEDGAQIMGVGELIAHDDQRCLPPGSGLLQDVVNGIIDVGGSQSDHALVSVGEGHGIQLPPVHRHHHGSRLLGLSGQALQAPVNVTGGNKHLINSPTAF